MSGPSILSLYKSSHSLITLIIHSICSVHGLGGNAFDTWMGSSKMWLRDLLPNSTPLGRSRIMTFGYDSSLINRKSDNRIRDWADELLRQVGYVRTSPEEHARPIIFICHSLVRSIVTIPCTTNSDQGRTSSTRSDVATEIASRQIRRDKARELWSHFP